MSIPSIVPIYFVYGLAFFSMGLLVMLEGGRSSDMRLRRALRPLAAFGLIHAASEWLEMFQSIAGLEGIHSRIGWSVCAWECSPFLLFPWPPSAATCW